jgi:rod shape-determining protein MreC
MADQRIQPGEKVLTAGGDLIFPRGLPVGVVERVVRDPDRDSFIDVIVKPAAHLDRLDEVLIITSAQPRFSPQDQQDLATSEALKGAEAAALAEQQKSSQIMAERLPGLTDPNAAQNSAAKPNSAATPGAAQAGQPQAQVNQAPAQPQVPRILPAQHPDRFSPAAAPRPSADSSHDPVFDRPTRPAKPSSPPTSPRRNP